MRLPSQPFPAPHTHNRCDALASQQAPTLTNQSSTQRRHFSSSARLSPAGTPAPLLLPLLLLPLPVLLLLLLLLLKRLLKKPLFFWLPPALPPLLALLPLLLVPLPEASISAASLLIIAELSLTCWPSTSTTGTFLYSDHLSSALVRGLTSTQR